MIGPAGFAGRSGLRPRRTPRSPWREWLPSSLRWDAEGGTGRSVWLENSRGFDRWCVGSNGLATRAARGSTRGRGGSPPVASTHMYRGSRVAWPRVETGVSARACPPGRVPKRVGERGGKKKRASPNRRPRSRPRREATPARDAEPRTGCALTSRVRTNVPRAFRANGCASRVCRRGEAPVGGGSLSRRHLKISFDNSSHLSGRS